MTRIVWERGVAQLLLGLALLALSACAAHSNVPAQGALQVELHVLPETYLDGGTAQDFKLVTREQAGTLVCQVQARGARRLKAFYAEIESGNPAAVISAEPGPGLEADGGALCLARPYPADPRRVALGVVQIKYPAREGFSGDGVVAEVVLRPNRQATQAKAAAAVPVSDQAAAILGYSLNMVWWVHNPGDYDQNGEVNITDITPLGANFGAVGPFSMTDGISCVDGDDNGELNISDLTPIGMNFGNRIEGYYLYFSVDPSDYPTSNTGPNGPGATILGLYELTGQIPSDDFRRHYQESVPAPQPEGCYWVRPYADGVFGTPSNLWSMDGTWHLKTVCSGAAGDFTGLNCSLALIDGQPAIAFTQAGRPMYVRAGNELGTTWHAPVAVCADPAVTAQQVALASIGDRPGIAYYDVLHDVVAYTQGADAAGESWSTPAEVCARSVHYELALAEVNQRAAVAFDAEPLIPGPPELYYERAGDNANTNWAAASTRIDNGNEADYATLAVVNGNPAVAFRTPGVGLHFTYATDINGNGWAPPVLVHADNGVIAAGIRPRLTLYWDQPAITYQVLETPTRRAPYFVRAADAQGSGFWNDPAPLALDDRDPCESGSWTGLACNGFAAYYDASNGQLRCSTAYAGSAGAAWYPAELVDAGGGNSVGGYCSAADVGGHIGIAYYDAGAQALKFAALY